MSEAQNRRRISRAGRAAILKKWSWSPAARDVVDVAIMISAVKLQDSRL